MRKLRGGQPLGRSGGVVGRTRRGLAKEQPAAGSLHGTTIGDVARNGPEGDLVGAAAVGSGEHQLLAFGAQPKIGVAGLGQGNLVAFGQIASQAAPLFDGQRAPEQEDLHQIATERTVGARPDLDQCPHFTPRRGEPGTDAQSLMIQFRLPVRVVEGHHLKAGSQRPRVHRQGRHVAGAVFVHREAVGADGQAGPSINVAAVRCAKQPPLAADAAHARSRLRIHLVGLRCTEHGEDAKTVRAHWSRESEQIIGAIEAQRRRMSCSARQPTRLKGLALLRRVKPVATGIQPTPDKHLAAADPDLGEVGRVHLIGPQPHCQA